MKKAKLTAHMIVKNEEYWIWYAIHSVLPLIDAMLIFDTGSTDKTPEIISAFPQGKVVFEKKGPQKREGLVSLRNEMVKRTKTDWFILVDGDEIWPRSGLKAVVKNIQNSSDDTWGLVVRTRNCVGDVWHYQPESAGRYELLGRKGHLSIRVYRKLPGFTWQGEYPNEAYCDDLGNPINDQDEHLRFVDVAYWHVTHLPRSSRSQQVIDRTKKRKLERGIKAKRIELPEVFFAQRPVIVPSPWMRPTILQQSGAAILTPLRRVKRRLFR